MDVVSLSDNPNSMCSVMAAIFLASASLLSASVLRDSSVIMSFSSSSSTSRLLTSSHCFLSNSSLFISASTLCCFSCSANMRVSRAFYTSNLSARVLELDELLEEQIHGGWVLSPLVNPASEARLTWSPCYKKTLPQLQQDLSFAGLGH